MTANFRFMEADVPARSEDHASCVDITIMRSTTVGTIPASHSETFQPSRAADASAFGTGLGTPSFVGFNIHCLPSGSLVSQHMPECAPARIKNGLRHLGTGELSGIHIADDDQTVFPRQIGAGDVKMVTPRIGDLGMDRADAALVPSALSLGKRGFVSPIVSERRDFSPVAARGECLQAKINSDFAVAGGKVVFDLALKGYVPAPASVLHKSTGFERAFDLPRFPKPEPALQVGHSITVNAHGPRDKGNPAERPFGSEAGAELRTLTLGITRCGELATDGLHSVGMQAEHCPASGAELDQVIGGRPADIHTRLTTTFGFTLRRSTEIPDLIAGLGVMIKMLSSRRILDPVFVSKYHAILFTVRHLSIQQAQCNYQQDSGGMR